MFVGVVLGQLVWVLFLLCGEEFCEEGGHVFFSLFLLASRDR